ncbi:MAG: 50S ribosomal protein L25 [Patescibacteria group bacterium]|nr:50S ribosomal protein L25 [Patescibacteria group bacterium]
MKTVKLAVAKRTISGKKVKKLRKEGIIPANIYGKKTKSLSVGVSGKEFLKVFREAGETGLVELFVEGEKEARPVLIHNLQKHPVSGQVLHADFYQVDLTQKVKANIPVEEKGEAGAVSENKGVLLHVLEEIEVEALPQDLPEHIEVDVTALSEVDQEILVKDLAVDKSKIEVLTKDSEIVFKIGPLITREQEEEIKAQEAKKAAEAAEKTVVESGAAPAAGEASKAEEKPAEAKPQEEKKV